MFKVHCGGKWYNNGKNWAGFEREENRFINFGISLEWIVKICQIKKAAYSIRSISIAGFPSRPPHVNVIAADAHSLRIQIETGQHEAEAGPETVSTTNSSQ